ncbi:conjugation system SOS inhibitor PsiB [Serratia marcescens]|uniref:conjugation system SOS inhibitor PsiB n=1 Tax=Serratia marcescens TaxID=615 RepID=UPI0013D9D22A|nr:conjugation system SOS inhibitor PsiB [Serratia marcescens]
MKNQKLSLSQVAVMSAFELEQYRDRGSEARRQLNNIVLGQLALPDGWSAVAEEASEFCGQVPVVCRISPRGDDNLVIFLCSAGNEVPEWSAFLPYQETKNQIDQGNRVAWLHTAENFDPDTVNKVLATVGDYYRHGFNQSAQLAAALRMGGLCV